MDDERDLELEEEDIDEAEAEDDIDEDIDDTDENEDIEDEDEDIDLDTDEEDEANNEDENDEDEDDADNNAEAEGEESNAPTEDKDKKISDLQKMLDAKSADSAKNNKVLKAALANVGIEFDGEDVTAAVIKLAADAEGVTVEEYMSRMQGADTDGNETEEGNKAEDNADNKPAKPAVKNPAKYDDMAAQDLSELKLAHPDLASKGNIAECFNSQADILKYGAMRDAGVSAKEAYVAINANKIAAKNVVGAKKDKPSGKEHIKSTVPKKVDDSDTVSVTQLKRYREECGLDNMPLKEVKKLYKKAVLGK